MRVAVVDATANKVLPQLDVYLCSKVDKGKTLTNTMKSLEAKEY